MICWETVAKLLYEIKSGGRFSNDVLGILAEELSLIADPQFNAKVSAITSAATFGTPSDIDALFCLLSETDEFSVEIGKITAAKLSGIRDA